MNNRTPNITSNENLAEWMLLLYLLRTLNEYEKKPRYKRLKKHHLDGVEIHKDFIEPYRDTLRKYIDVCQLIEEAEVLPVKHVDSVVETYELVDLVVRDKIII